MLGLLFLRKMQVTATALLVLMLVIAALPLSAQSADWLPAPTGTYEIGTTYYHWTDATRNEVFTAEPDDRREVMVRLWYPAKVHPEAEPVTYLPRATLEAPYLANVPGATSFALPISEIAGTPTHSYRDAPLSDAQTNFPVIIYSDGWQGSSVLATSQMEELASHGYIVVSVEHPYISEWTVFPGRRVVAADNASSDGAQEAVAQDIIFVLDQLTLLNEAFSVFALQRLDMLDEAMPGDQFTGRLDLERVGVLGAAWGGGPSLLACLNDERLAAVLVEGAYILPEDVMTAGIDVPVMFIDDRETPSASGFEVANRQAYHVSVNSSSNQSYGDYLLWSEDTNAARSVPAINAYIRAFFDRHSRGLVVPLLNGPSPDFPDVTFETRDM